MFECVYYVFECSKRLCWALLWGYLINVPSVLKRLLEMALRLFIKLLVLQYFYFMLWVVADLEEWFCFNLFGTYVLACV